MRLEHAPDLLMGIIFGSVKGCFDLRRMVGVIVDHCHSANFSLVLKTTVGSCKAENSFGYHIPGKVEKAGSGNNRKRVGHVVDSRNAEGTCSKAFALIKHGERGAAKFIVRNISGSVIGFAVNAVSNDGAVKPFCDGLILRRICVDDQRTVFWKKLGKLTEGVSDIMDILEEIQMICINIQDNADFWEKA